jgi:hypothetical protein
MSAVIPNVQILCTPKNVKNGKFPYRDATTATMPRLTSTIGITQHTSVADEVKRISQPHCLGFFILFMAAILFFLNRWARHADVITKHAAITRLRL